MNIRKLTEQDIEESWVLELDTPDIYLRWPKEDLLASHLHDEVYGLFNDNQLIGRIGLIDKGTEGIEVDGLVVHTKYRHRGFGKLLVAHAIQELKKRHANKVFLFTHPDNNASLILYLKSGFKIKEWIPDKFGPGKHRLKLILNLEKEASV